MDGFGDSNLVWISRATISPSPPSRTCALDCAVEAETEGGRGQVVVNGFRDCDDRLSFFKQLMSDSERSVTADADQTIDLELLDILLGFG